MQFFVFLSGLLLFIGLVLVHEWGHFFAARRNGVDADEFGLGFPPRIVSKKLKSGLILSVNWLPLGGFVKLKGEHDSDRQAGSFGAASLWAKTKIMLAGVTANFLVAVLMLTLLAWGGMPKLITQDNLGQDQLTVASDTRLIKQKLLAHYVIKGSPADKVGLRGTDELVSVGVGNNIKKVNTTKQIHDANLEFAGQTVQLTYIRNSQTITKPVKLLSKAEVDASNKACQASNDINKCKGYLGIQPVPLEVQRSTWSAPIVALGLTKQVIIITLQGLGHALSGLGSTIAGGVTGNHQARENGQDQASSQVGGPVAIAVSLWDSGYLGFNIMLFFIALISLTLAIINILPIPALDGGRLFMILISRGVFKRALSQKTEERIIGASFALLMVLVVLITVVDVKRFF